MNQRRLSGASAADDADGLAGPGQKADPGEGLRPCRAIGDPGIAKFHLPPQRLHRVTATRNLAGLDGQDSLNPVAAGHRFGHGNDEVGKLDQLYQNLRHIVIQRHNLSLGQRTRMHPEGAGMQERHYRQIQDHIRHRIEQVGNPAHPELKPVQQLISSGKFRNLLRFLPKCPQDPHPGEILPGGSRHAVQVALHLPVHGNRHQNDGEDHCQQHGYRHSKHQRSGHINGKGHHHSAKHHKGRPEQQAQGQIHPILQLIHIAGHAGNHGSGAQRVDLPVRQPLNMGKQRAPQPGGKAGSRLRRKNIGP